jgi:uncharacterized phage-like protein YoqJ
VIICATGHRPDKLGGYREGARIKLRELAIWYLRAQRPDKVISGMALGWDTAFAEAAIVLRIPFIAAVPFPGQEFMWPKPSQETFRFILSQAAEVIEVSPGPYAAWKMQVRNKHMVNSSDKVCALWDGSTGGTANCIEYAKSIGRPIENLWQQFIA